MTEHKSIVAALARFPKYEFHHSGCVVSFQKKTARKLKPIKMGAYVGLQLLRADGTREKAYLHRLICEAFNGPCPDGMQCRHLDGDKTNNAASNLAWGTKAENEADKLRHGSHVNGEKNPMAVLTEVAVCQMRDDRKRTGDSYAKIAARYSVSTMTAYRAITEQSWR